MRRVKIILLTVLLLGLCTACENRYYESNKEMVKRLQKESGTSAEMSECAYLQLEENTLIWGIIGDSEQTYNYYAAQFFEEKAGKYSFEKTVPLDDLGWQLRGCKWNDGYALFCNNKNVVRAEASITTKGEKEKIADEEVIGIPWVYYLDLSNYQEGYEMEISFLDVNGNVVQ